MKSRVILGSCLVMGLVAAVIIGIRSHRAPHIVKSKVSSFLPPLNVRLKQNAHLIAKLKSDPRPASQDALGEAQLHLGFDIAKTHDFEASRKEFLEASKIKGTGKMSADFGGINDQAAYQAIVCLVPEHREAEAKLEFRKFMRENQLSPLVHAAYKRLLRLNHGKSEPGDEVLLQQAIIAQESRIRFETSVCGPKTVEYLLNLKTSAPNAFQQCSVSLPKNQSTDYKSLARLFGTTDKGTSLSQMRAGLKKLGIESFGMQVNRKDFAKLPLPAIMLSGDHYLALLAMHDRAVDVYDSRYSGTQSVPLPSLDDPDFLATVLTFKPITQIEGDSQP